MRCLVVKLQAISEIHIDVCAFIQINSIVNDQQLLQWKHNWIRRRWWLANIIIVMYSYSCCIAKTNQTIATSQTTMTGICTLHHQHSARVVDLLIFRHFSIFAHFNVHRNEHFTHTHAHARDAGSMLFLAVKCHLIGLIRQSADDLYSNIWFDYITYSTRLTMD